MSKLVRDFDLDLDLDVASPGTDDFSKSAGEDSVAVVAQRPKRAKAARRRQIDPTTCEREYSSDELEFMRAMDQYKRTSGRMFPTCSEILEVLRGLGYIRVSTAL